MDREQSASAVQEPEAPSTLGVMARGVFMGLAEVVPGVSGGTIALITGIYHHLVGALASFGPSSIGLLRDVPEFIRVHKIGFLMSLAAGMGVGILLFGNLMSYLLAEFEPLVWAFFFGVIGASVWVIGRHRPVRYLVTFSVVGLILGLALLWLPAADGSVGPLDLFVGGAVAVCAWLLPAVSGSYMLLVMGLYQTVIDAVATLDLATLAIVAAGCAIGLLLFAKVLAWLLKHWYEQVLALLTGFMLGSMVKLWPWQLSGAGSVYASLTTPAQYEQATAQPAMLAAAIGCACAGAVGLWLLSTFTTQR